MSLYSLNAFLIIIRFLAVLLLDGFSITRLRILGPLITRLRIIGLRIIGLLRGRLLIIWLLIIRLILGRQHIARLRLVEAFARLRAVWFLLGLAVGVLRLIGLTSIVDVIALLSLSACRPLRRELRLLLGGLPLRARRDLFDTSLLRFDARVLRLDLGALGFRFGLRLLEQALSVRFLLFAFELLYALLRFLRDSPLFFLLGVKSCLLAFKKHRLLALHARRALFAFCHAAVLTSGPILLAALTRLDLILETALLAFLALRMASIANAHALFSLRLVFLFKLIEIGCKRVEARKANHINAEFTFFPRVANGTISYGIRLLNVVYAAIVHLVSVELNHRELFELVDERLDERKRLGVVHSRMELLLDRAYARIELPEDISFDMFRLVGRRINRRGADKLVGRKLVNIAAARVRMRLVEIEVANAPLGRGVVSWRWSRRLRTMARLKGARSR